MNDTHKIAKLGNRLRRLNKRVNDKKNPLSPRQTARLAALREQLAE